MRELRLLQNYGRLGRRVNEDISESLWNFKIQHFPQTLSTSQKDYALLYLAGTPIALLIEAVTEPTYEANGLLRDLALVASENTTIMHSALQYQQILHSRQTGLDSASDALSKILREHGRPLHWEVLCQIIRDRFPDFQYSDQVIYQALRQHKERFNPVTRGVYALAEWQ